MFNETVKSNIGLEIRHFFNKKDISEIVDLYEKVVFFSVDADNGVSLELDEGLYCYFLQSGNIRQAHKTIVNIEPFLKKLLKIVDADEYNALSTDHGLSRVMKLLNIMDYLPQEVKRNFTTVDVNSITDPLARAIVNTYQVRNVSAHESQAWSLTEMCNNISNVLATACYAVWINRSAIKQAEENETRNQYDFKTYVKQIIKPYEDSIKAGFRYVPLIWAHVDDSGEATFDVGNISKNRDKKVLLVGEAGCGKTTILNYMEYSDAKEYLSGKNYKLPIKISLIDENYKYQSIEELICNRLNIPMDYCHVLLGKGLINLYLDGLNEIISSIEIKKNIAIDIEKFCELYPNTLVIVTDRPYTIVKMNFVQEYKLRKLSKDDVIMYAKSKKSFSDKVENKIMEMLSMPEFSDYEYTPIFINQLVEIFAMGRGVPKDENELLDNYLQVILEREYNEKKDYNAAPGRLDLLLTELTNLEGIEDGTHYSKVLKFFAQKANEYGLAIKAEECLNLALQLGILKKQGDFVQFYSNEYMTYYLMKSLDI